MRLLVEKYKTINASGFDPFVIEAKCIASGDKNDPCLEAMCATTTMFTFGFIQMMNLGNDAGARTPAQIEAEKKQIERINSVG